MPERVLVDTCIWASVFAKPNSAENRAVEQLIEHDRVVVIGPVLAEVLCGFRRSEQADWAASRLRNLGWIEVEWDDWRQAAAFGRQLAANGHRLPLTDLAIAAIASRHDLSVYTVDPEFDLLTNLQRFP
ncbi:MAG: PIN domain-containing protein [Planctomycetota bacterium]